MMLMSGGRGLPFGRGGLRRWRLGGIVLAYLGIAVMALAVVLVLSARRFPARRPALERWSGNLFLVGAMIWVIHYARFLIP